MLNKYLSHDWKDCNSLMTLNPIVNHFYLFKLLFSLVQFSHSVVSDSLRPHESQHARPPCPSPTPGVHSDSRPSSQWCHPAISSSVIPFSSCPQSLPASESFPMSQLFTSGGQSTGVCFSIIIRKLDISILDSLCLTQWQISQTAYFIEDHE